MATSKKGTRRKPHGRDEIVAAVLVAATDLMAEHGPDAVSLRAIAERAGVNYGLIHRHLGSRDEVIRQALDKQMASIIEQLRERGLTPATALQILAEHPLLVDAVFRAALARTRMETYRPEKPVVQRLLRPEGSDPAEAPTREQRLRVAAFVAFIFGWVALEDGNLRSLGFEDEDREALRIDVARFAPDPGVVRFD